MLSTATLSTRARERGPKYRYPVRFSANGSRRGAASDADSTTLSIWNPDPDPGQTDAAHSSTDRDLPRSLRPLLDDMPPFPWQLLTRRHGSRIINRTSLTITNIPARRTSVQVLLAWHTECRLYLCSLPESIQVAPARGQSDLFVAPSPPRPDSGLHPVLC